MTVATPQSQGHKSLRVFKTLTTPVTFSKTDANSYVPFVDPTINPAETDPFDGTVQGTKLTKSQGVMMRADSGNADYSFDGTTVHGTIKSTDGLLSFVGMREKEIYFKQNGGAATVRVWAW